MEVIKLVFILALILGNIFCQDMDVDRWRDVSGENKWPNSEILQDMSVRMTRKPGPRQNLGLMGKINIANAQRARKRHKFQTFVGLMGKRSFEHRGTLGDAHRTEDY